MNKSIVDNIPKRKSRHYLFSSETDNATTRALFICYMNETELQKMQEFEIQIGRYLMGYEWAESTINYKKLRYITNVKIDHEWERFKNDVNNLYPNRNISIDDDRFLTGIELYHSWDWTILKKIFIDQYDFKKIISRKNEKLSPI